MDIEVVTALPTDLVVAAGDLTQRAKSHEFEQARAVLDGFGGVPIVVTPGNHDVPLYRFWERLLVPFAKWTAFAGPELDTAHRIPGATVVALASAAPRRAIVNGRIVPRQLGFARRTFAESAEGDLRMEDLIPNDGCVITVTKSGFIKRTSVDEYRSQNRGGKGVIGSGQQPACLAGSAPGRPATHHSTSVPLLHDCGRAV